MISPTGKAEVVLWKSGCSDSTQEKTYPILSQGPWSDIYEDFIPHKKKQNIFAKIKMSKLHLTTIHPSRKDFDILKNTAVNAKKAFFILVFSAIPGFQPAGNFASWCRWDLLWGPCQQVTQTRTPCPRKSRRGELWFYTDIKVGPFFWISTLNDSAPPSLVTKLERGRQLQS